MWTGGPTVGLTRSCASPGAHISANAHPLNSGQLNIEHFTILNLQDFGCRDSADMSEEGPDAVEDGRLRVRRTRSQLIWPESGVLASAFEEDNNIRTLYRENRGHLLRWPSPELVGVASLKALALNVRVLAIALRIWAK